MEQAHFESLYQDTTRSEDIGKIAKFIKDGTSCQLISIPGVGRSLILGLLAHNKSVYTKHFESPKPHFVLVNFSEIRKRSLFDTTKFLFLCISDSLRDGKSEEYKKINDLFGQALKFNDELVLFQALKGAIDYLVLEKKIKVVMLFDHFEEYVPTVTSEFFTNLRTLRNRAKYQFSVIFSVNRPLEDLLDTTTLSDFYDLIAGNNIYLPLSDSVTADFRTRYIEKITGKKVSKDVLSEIIRLTAGVGKLVKLSVEKYLGHAGKIKDMNEYLLSQKIIQTGLSEICSSLLPSEQAYLIKGKLDDKSVQEYLENVGLIREDKIQIPLFEEHIKMHAAQLKKDVQKIVFDENTGEIKIGDVVLSDQLTASEFKLLNFLLKNNDKIVDRDEIIGVVWSDVKSTAGITDQAVDQLIFRLRRKIEENPNTPAHLLTVKGRGFKFLP